MKTRFIRTSVMVGIVVLLAVVAGWTASPFVDDGGRFFSNATVTELGSRIEKVKNASGKDIYVITVDKLEGKSIDEAAVEFGKSRGVNGVVIYISRVPSKLTVKVGKNTARLITEEKKARVRDIMVAGFKDRKFDEGILKAVGMLESEMTYRAGGMVGRETRPAAPRAPEGSGAPAREKGTNWLLIILLAVGAFLIIRMILGALSGGAQQAAAPGTPGAPGGGGGFLSGLLGGLGGAMLGNWLYGAFSGQRHGDETHAAGSTGDFGGGASDPSAGWQANDAGGFSGGSDSADWGGGGGGDFGGGGGGDF